MRGKSNRPHRFIATHKYWNIFLFIMSTIKRYAAWHAWTVSNSVIYPWIPFKIRSTIYVIHTYDKHDIILACFMSHVPFFFSTISFHNDYLKQNGRIQEQMNIYVCRTVWTTMLYMWYLYHVHCLTTSSYCYDYYY